MKTENEEKRMYQAPTVQYAQVITEGGLCVVASGEQAKIKVQTIEVEEYTNVFNEVTFE